MERNARTVTAVFLACVFLFLSLAAEFSHNHLSLRNTPFYHNQSCNLSDHQAYFEDQTFVCIACVHSQEHPVIRDRLDVIAPVQIAELFWLFDRAFIEAESLPFLANRAPPLPAL